jgi:hypothetical protein
MSPSTVLRHLALHPKLMQRPRVEIHCAAQLLVTAGGNRITCDARLVLDILVPPGGVRGLDRTIDHPF